MTTAEVIAVLQRLAATQRNLPVPVTEEEREALREAAWMIETLETALSSASVYAPEFPDGD